MSNLLLLYIAYYFFILIGDFMKALKKIVLAMLISCMLVMPFASSAHATDLIDPDNINSIAKYFGIDLSDPSSIQNLITQLQDGGLSGLLSLLGINISEILDELQSYLGAMEIPTTQPPTTEEPTTEEPTTEEPTTAAPVYTTVAPTYNYTPVVTTTQPETTTFQFIPPEQIYTEAFTTTVFQPVVEDNTSSLNDANPIKTAIGVLLLLGSGIGVIIVVLALKRNRI